MPALVHLQIKASSEVLSPISCLKKFSRTTMACSRSTLSLNDIGHRTSPPLRCTQIASACLAERHGPATPCICFRRRSGSGNFSPMARYTGLNSQFAGARNEYELGMNYVIAGHNARISTYWRTGNIGGASTFNGQNLNYAPGSTGQHVDTFHVALQLQY